MWPKLRVEWYDPKHKQEIITREQAQKRFGLSAQDLAWLDSPYVSGTGLRAKNNDEVRTLWRYTLEDSIRDAAPELLKTLKAVVAVLQSDAPGTPLNNRKYDALGTQARAAIAKAEGREV